MKNFILTVLLIAACVTLCPSSVDGQSFESNISSYGLAMPKDNVMLRSNIDSHVKTVLVHEGQWVRKGDVLVELNCETALAKLQIARLAFAEEGARLNAMAELDFANSNFEKSSSLFMQKAVNAKELEEAELRLRSAAASLKMIDESHSANEAKLKLAQAELEDHVIRAPFDGQVAELKVGVGSAVTPNTDLIQVISSDNLRVNLYLPVQVAGKLEQSGACQLKIEEPFRDLFLDAQIVFRSPIIEATTGAQRVTFEIDNRKHRLPAGFSVTLHNPMDDPVNQWLSMQAEYALKYFMAAF